eukprot:365565-Chlamydomonas_euryale.AAC.3
MIGDHLELSSKQQVAGSSSDQEVEVEGHFGCNTTILTTHAVPWQDRVQQWRGCVSRPEDNGTPDNSCPPEDNGTPEAT